MMWDGGQEYDAWPVMIVAMVLFWALVVVGVVVVVRWMRAENADPPRRDASGPSSRDPGCLDPAGRSDERSMLDT